MKASDYIVEFLKKIRITHIFGYPGGAVTHIIDSIYKCDGICFIGMGNEQGAAFAAEGYSRASGKIGVALATSGPGATNLITGIGSAYFDSVPVIYITGQVNTYEYKKSFENTANIRQLGFQETDIVQIVKPITKYAVRITKAEDLQSELLKAINIAKSGRQGPVLIDIPMNIQRADVDFDISDFNEEIENDYDGIDTNSIISLINSANRPVLLIGGGCRILDNNALKKLVFATQIPVVASLMGLERMNFEYENFLGLIGAYGSRYANKTLAESDLIISLGSRLDNRQTAKRDNFAKSAKLIRVDVDKNEFAYKVKSDEINIYCDCEEFVQIMADCADKLCPVNDEWISHINEMRENYSISNEPYMDMPARVMENISACCNCDTVTVTDVGQNQIWAAQFLKTEKLCKFMTSGGMGAMGFSLPVAIGAAFALPNKQIVSINGDGGMNMNIQELHTVKRYNLPIKVIVLNNHALGMIRHFQEMYFDSLYAGTVIDYDTPDFAKIAKAYGIESYMLDENFTVEALSEIFSKDCASLTEITLPQTTYIFPKLAVGQPIENQDPQIN